MSGNQPVFGQFQSPKVKVIRSKVLGFCMGVRRAVTMVYAETDRAGETIYTSGPLIHNPSVMDELKKRGVREISDLSVNLEGSSVIIRAHGIAPSTENDLRNRGARIVDATCPKVKASQLKAKALAEEGYRLFLAGDAHHAEIEGILGYAGEGVCTVVSNPDEAKAAAEKLYNTEKDAKTALAGQTTICMDEYIKIGEAIRNFFPALEIAQTICAATMDRQQALRELLDNVDAVIIAGGRESSNTRRLLAIAQESGKPCALAENSGEIPEEFYTCETIGLSAGASTPDSVIDEIERGLLGKN